ncbi:MAG: hypothetical protein K0R28_549 [Paenibacillus sp.]|jgi:hypothetical protein|nr:hypothetical protein [Paenibacillus sp.]
MGLSRALDDIVPVDQISEMIHAAEQYQSNIKLTIYPDLRHGHHGLYFEQARTLYLAFGADEVQLNGYERAINNAMTAHR